MQFLDEDKVRSLLTWESLIPAVERALTNLSTGKLQQPLRTVLRIPDETTHETRGFLALMPAVDGDLMGVKLVTFFERNTTVPTHQAVIQLLSAKTGEPLIAMDGRLITEMRTAAVSAIAARLLAPNPSKILAILGSGVQARSHLRALRLIRNFQEVRVWSRTAENARRFASEFGVTVVDTAEAAARGADVVVNVAAVREPLVRGEWLAPNSLVCAVAVVTPDRRELDDAAMNAAIIVESREAALRESGDLIGSGQTVYAEIGEILAGSRPIPQGRVVLKSLGVAACDLAAATIVWQASQNDASA
ncbi:MAG TPA: ornithine cyclodeaminase family protein [Acidobacteriaceae bacterium]|jgi:thiomorpholine-carboxylate dehydrogenase|nr:ornithine cyclodeaminase family protein [Acidobacteriaceae bacterium]